MSRVQAQVADAQIKHKHKQRQKQKKSKKGRQVIKNRKVGRWFLGETLGKGGYSWVKKGYDRKDGRVVALKFTSKAKNEWSAAQSKQIQNEIEALRQIKHKNVLQLLAYNLNAKYPQKDGLVIPSVLLVLEYLPGGELFDILYYTAALSEDIARTYFGQLIEGLEACHAAGICHRDIKPQNLLLDASFQLKIADFGLSKVFQQDENQLMSTFYVGTRGYQAPEILKKKPYTVSCDIFSCGVVLFILLAGYPPFESATSKCRWYAPLTVSNAREFWKQHRGSTIPGPAKDLITRMFWYNPAKRISLRGIKRHKWYTGKRLPAKTLAQELRKLHRLMEIKRRDDAEKQSQLQNSVTRDVILGEQTVSIYDAQCSPEQALMMSNVYFQGATIENVAEVTRAILKSESTINTVDCTAQFIDHFWQKSKSKVECNSIVAGIGQLLKNHKDVQAICSQKDAYISLTYSDAAGICNPPQFPENETVTLKDVFTTCHPRLVLTFIQSLVLELGGAANLDLKHASLEAHLATHNFPAPVSIQTRMFHHVTYDCYLVKFERIGGDALHFGRVLRKLIKDSGPVLTGLPDKHFGNVSHQEIMKAHNLFDGLFPSAAH